MTRRITLAALLGALLLVLVPAAVAGKPGGSTSTAATLKASPNPVPAWSQYSLSGCGYVTGKQVSFVVNTTEFFATAVDSNGCLVPVKWWVSGPGSYRIDAFQRLRGRKQTLMATTMQSAF